MHTLEPEIRILRAEGALDDATASRSIALDRGDVFSLHRELRLTLYAGVALVTGGVGTILARNIDRIGPLAIVVAVAAAAVACGLPAVRARRAGQPLSTVADYLLLLAVLLASADLGYAEHAFELLGPLWSWHLLLLAAFHALVAYTFRSSLVLSASLAALAGWFGVGASFSDVPLLDTPSPEVGARALSCAAVIATWRFADRYRDPATPFMSVFDHVAMNVAFWGALAWCHPMPWLLAGLPLLVVLSAMAIRKGLGEGREMFLVYGVGYAALGVCIAIAPRISGGRAAPGFVLLVVCAAAASLWQLRQKIRESRG
ncbi:MAG: DUF2157 domain-containing protein [Gammaproteobacteria bacterium]|nr:DUF2157 domain-containing protein [Gammaproteobacteria bacterium]